MPRIEQNVNLEQLVNQLSNINSNFISRRFTGNNNQTGNTCPPNTPNTLREVLCSLVGEQVQITTPFGVIEGTLLAVRSDYIVLVDDTGSQILVPTENIETVSEL